MVYDRSIINIEEAFENIFVIWSTPIDSFARKKGHKMQNTARASSKDANIVTSLNLFIFPDLIVISLMELASIL